MLNHADFYFKDLLSHIAIKLIFIYKVNMTLASKLLIFSISSL